MRRLGLLLVSSLLFILPAAAGQAGPQKTLTIKLRSVVQTTTANDVEPKGPSAGDRVTVTDRLYNLVPQFGKPKGALVGRDTATVTVLAGNVWTSEALRVSRAERFGPADRSRSARRHGEFRSSAAAGAFRVHAAASRSTNQPGGATPERSSG
jgi:hypothetical protein